MTTRNEIIRKTIEYMPNDKLKFKKGLDDRIEMCVNNNNTIIIYKDDTWEKVKFKLDRVYKIKIPNDVCGICYDPIDKFKMACPKCMNVSCITCYMKGIIKNRGLVKCPYCRHECGCEAQINDDERLDYLIKYNVNLMFDKKGNVVDNVYVKNQLLNVGNACIRDVLNGVY